MDSSGPSTPKRTKHFSSNWLEQEEFKGWLEQSKESGKAFCRACRSFLIGGKSELLKHGKCSKHVQNMKMIKNVPSIMTSFIKQKDPHKIAVKVAEVHLAAFFCEHNLALSIVDHLCPLLKKIAPDSKILNDIALSRRKCTGIIKNVLAKVETEDLIDMLKTSSFSILIDESTDISNKKQLCVLVRFLNRDFSICTRLLELVEINAADCNAVNLYEAFKTSLTSKGIPLENITGLACDGASVMIGKHNSFYTKLKSDVPKVILFKCICHSAALVASAACDELPGDCEWLMKSIASFINESSKSSAILAELQESFNVESRKMLKPSTTRWLSMLHCVIRLLENWEVLQHFFLLAATETKRNKATKISSLLLDNKMKAYFSFLKFTLHYFNEFNALFQSKTLLIHILAEESKKLLLKVGQNFLNPEALELVKYNVLSIDLDDPSNFKEDVYLGPDCEEHINKNLDPRDVKEIKTKCKNFYVTSFKAILKRFDFDNGLLKELEFLNPAVALDLKKRDEVNSLQLLSSYLNIDKSELAQEWRSLPLSFPDKVKDGLKLLTADEFWKTIIASTNFKREPMFPNLNKIAEYAMTFPHSNAEAERIFSMVTDIKTRKRNKIGEDSLNSLCLVRSSMQSQGKTCVDFVVDEKHMRLMNPNMNIYK